MFLESVLGLIEDSSYRSYAGCQKKIRIAPLFNLMQLARWFQSNLEDPSLVLQLYLLTCEDLFEIFKVDLWFKMRVTLLTEIIKDSI